LRETKKRELELSFLTRSGERRSPSILQISKQIKKVGKRKTNKAVHPLRDAHQNLPTPSDRRDGEPKKKKGDRREKKKKKPDAPLVEK